VKQDDLRSRQLRAFRARESNHREPYEGVFQKGLFLRRWRFYAQFNGDMMKTWIENYRQLEGICAEWTDAGLYYSDEPLTNFIRAIMPRVSFAKVVTEKEMLEADASWREEYQFRVLFPCTPGCSALSVDRLLEEGFGKTGEIVAEYGAGYEDYVVAYLTNCKESCFLVALMAADPIIENRDSETVSYSS
jgi:hypothetical protein